MTEAALSRFQHFLEGLCHDLEQRPQSRDAIAVENGPDALDRLRLAAECNVAIHRFESLLSRIQSVKLALGRIKDGSYGTCLGCDEEISEKRLQAAPWASHCICCQQIAESDRIRRADAGRQLWDVA